MKIRTDFVTNSSSSSFICCFARIANREKAQPILDEHKNNIEIYTAREVLEALGDSKWSDWLEYYWAGVNCTPERSYIEKHMDDSFIVIRGGFEIYEDGDGYPDYSVYYDDFDESAIIDKITEENGFAETYCECGAGRNG